MRALTIKFFGISVVCLLALTAGARRADASIVTTENVAGLFNVPGAILIDFQNLAGETSEITNQYAALGLSFSGGLHAVLSGEAGNIAVTATNGDPFNPPPPPPITVNFLQAGRRFGLDIRTDPGAVTDFHIVAYYGGVQTLNVTETFDTGGQFKSFGIAEDDSNLWFDAITISARAGDQQTTPSAFMIDNVRAVVPEPASLALFGIGALAVFGGKRAARRPRV